MVNNRKSKYRGTCTSKSLVFHNKHFLRVDRVESYSTWCPVTHYTCRKLVNFSETNRFKNTLMNIYNISLMNIYNISRTILVAISKKV